MHNKSEECNYCYPWGKKRCHRCEPQMIIYRRCSDDCTGIPGPRGRRGPQGLPGEKGEPGSNSLKLIEKDDYLELSSEEKLSPEILWAVYPNGYLPIDS